jgi:putative hydrolase of the HAD superfamily
VPLPRRPRAVTFDCWSTLIYEVEPERTRLARVEALLETARRLGADVEHERAARALAAAWERHWELWAQRTVSGAQEMARWSLEHLGLSDGVVAEELGRRLSETALGEEVRALEGARETLERLASLGIRRALICDTGFTPGHLVRRLLDRAGLLELLEVQIFSDEAGVPKPHPRVFEAALRGLLARPEDAVHVGDMRRTDIAGARGVGMGSIRMRWHHDDRSDHPDADAVADSHAHLRQIILVE